MLDDSQDGHVSEQDDVRAAGEEGKGILMEGVNFNSGNMVELKPKRERGDGFLNTMSNIVGDRNKLGNTQTVSTNKWAESGTQT